MASPQRWGPIRASPPSPSSLEDAELAAAEDRVPRSPAGSPRRVRVLAPDEGEAPASNQSDDGAGANGNGAGSPTSMDGEQADYEGSPVPGSPSQGFSGSGSLRGTYTVRAFAVTPDGQESRRKKGIGIHMPVYSPEQPLNTVDGELYLPEEWTRMPDFETRSDLLHTRKAVALEETSALLEEALPTVRMLRGTGPHMGLRIPYGHGANMLAPEAVPEVDVTAEISEMPATIAADHGLLRRSQLLRMRKTLLSAPAGPSGLDVGVAEQLSAALRTRLEAGAEAEAGGEGLPTDSRLHATTSGLGQTASAAGEQMLLTRRSGVATISPSAANSKPVDPSGCPSGQLATLNASHKTPYAFHTGATFAVAPTVLDEEPAVLAPDLVKPHAPRDVPNWLGSGEALVRPSNGSTEWTASVSTLRPHTTTASRYPATMFDAPPSTRTAMAAAFAATRHAEALALQPPEKDGMHTVPLPKFSETCTPAGVPWWVATKEAQKAWAEAAAARPGYVPWEVQSGVPQEDPIAGVSSRHGRRNPDGSPRVKNGFQGPLGVIDDRHDSLRQRFTSLESTLEKKHKPWDLATDPNKLNPWAVGSGGDANVTLGRSTSPYLQGVAPGSGVASPDGRSFSTTITRPGTTAGCADVWFPQDYSFSNSLVKPTRGLFDPNPDTTALDGKEKTTLASDLRPLYSSFSRDGIFRENSVKATRLMTRGASRSGRALAGLPPSSPTRRQTTGGHYDDEEEEEEEQYGGRGGNNGGNRTGTPSTSGPRFRGESREGSPRHVKAEMFYPPLPLDDEGATVLSDAFGWDRVPPGSPLLGGRAGPGLADPPSSRPRPLVTDVSANSAAAATLLPRPPSRVHMGSPISSVRTRMDLQAAAVNREASAARRGMLPLAPPEQRSPSPGRRAGSPLGPSPSRLVDTTGPNAGSAAVSYPSPPTSPIKVARAPTASPQAATVRKAQQMAAARQAKDTFRSTLPPGVLADGRPDMSMRTLRPKPLLPDGAQVYGDPVHETDSAVFVQPSTSSAGHSLRLQGSEVHPEPTVSSHDRVSTNVMGGKPRRLASVGSPLRGADGVSLASVAAASFSSPIRTRGFA